MNSIRTGVLIVLALLETIFGLGANSLRCGGVFTESSKQIIYKIFEPVKSNERCVWIVAPPNAASYRIKVTADFDFEAGFLNIGALNRGGMMKNSIRWTSSYPFEANILIVTFQSPPNATTKGFALEYNVNTRTNKFSFNATHSFIDQDTSHLKFPLNRSNYSNYELSTLVYPVIDNVYRKCVKKYLVYKLLGLEDGNHDFVDVYYFDSINNRFVFVERLNYAADMRQFSSDDMMLVTFHSDRSISHQGFSLTSVVPDCSCPL